MDEMKKNLRLQLSELEMLQSAYCNPDEIQLDDYGIVADIDEFLQNKTKILPQYLSFNVNLSVEDTKFELSVTLQTDYPKVLPEVFVRVNEQNRHQQNQMNADLSNYVSKIHCGEICIFSVISWILENLINYVDNKTSFEPAHTEKQKTLSRYWIHSHHIYSKLKRRDILKLADEYDLTGFALPGKPGIICLEGYTDDCNACWVDIKSMNWQKIICKHVETEENDNGSFKKFSCFQELIFNHENAHMKSTHMDMGEFFHYLEDYNCAYIFKDLFGIDGKSLSK